MVAIGFAGHEGYTVLWGFLRKKEYNTINIHLTDRDLEALGKWKALRLEL